jgi:flagellar protein FlaG
MAHDTPTGMAVVGRRSAAAQGGPAVAARVGTSPEIERPNLPQESRQAVAAANRALEQRARELMFEFDQDAGRVIVRLVDKRTGEVLRQVPSQEMLRIARTLLQDAAGALLQADA